MVPNIQACSADGIAAPRNIILFVRRGVRKAIREGVRKADRKDVRKCVREDVRAIYISIIILSY